MDDPQLQPCVFTSTDQTATTGSTLGGYHLHEFTKATGDNHDLGHYVHARPVVLGAPDLQIFLGVDLRIENSGPQNRSLGLWGRRKEPL